MFLYELLTLFWLSFIHIYFLPHAGHSQHQSRYATPRVRSRCNSALSTSPYRAGSFLHTEDEETSISIRSPQITRKAPLRRMKSNLAFEVLNEDDDFDDTQVNTNTSSVNVSDNHPPSSLSGGDGKGGAGGTAEEAVTSGLASLEIDDMPLSVSPLMSRRMDVKKILNAVNDSLHQ